MNTILFLSLMLPGTLFLGVYDVLARKILKSGLNERVLLSVTFCSSGFLLFIASLIFGLPEIKPDFWKFFSATVVLNTFAQWFWFKAFFKEEASLISPFRLVSPPIMILSGFVFLGEKVSLLGAAGIFVTILGLWLLLHSESLIKKESLFRILKKPGVLFAIFGAISFALSLPLDKGAVINSSALFFAGTGIFAVGFLNILLGLVFKDWNHASLKKLSLNKKTLPVFILIYSLGLILSVQALNYALAAYAGSVKRLTSFWAVLLGGRFLKEGNIGKKLFATAVMLLGVAVTVWLG